MGEQVPSLEEIVDRLLYRVTELKKQGEEGQRRLDAIAAFCRAELAR